MQLAQLLVADDAGSVRERARGLLGLGEGDHIADGFRAGQDGADAVNAEGDTAVRRCTELERFQQKPEFGVRLRVLDAERGEHAFL